MTARYENLFRKLKEKNEGAFVPFVVVGDPDSRRNPSEVL